MSLKTYEPTISETVLSRLERAIGITVLAQLILEFIFAHDTAEFIEWYDLKVQRCVGKITPKYINPITHAESAKIQYWEFLMPKKRFRDGVIIDFVYSPRYDRIMINKPTLRKFVDDPCSYEKYSPVSARTNMMRFLVSSKIDIRVGIFMQKVPRPKTPELELTDELKLTDE